MPTVASERGPAWSRPSHQCLRYVQAAVVGLVSAGALMLSACGDPGGKNNQPCDGPEDCTSGLCFDNQCVDPLGDQDGDGLNNGFEFQIGSNGVAPDTDGDGIIDPDELDGDELVDVDGDGRPDILESAIFDTDQDCTPDQFDPNEGIADFNAELVAELCQLRGICTDQESALRVSCTADSRRCDYSGVTGFADPEVACDRRDENCDGTVDEGFAEGCFDAVHASWSQPAGGGGGHTVATDRYRGTLMIGPAALGAVRTDRFTATIGITPAPSPLRPPSQTTEAP